MEQPSITQITGNESEPINLDVPPVPAKPIDNVFGDEIEVEPIEDDGHTARTKAEWIALGRWPPYQVPQEAAGDVKKETGG